MLKDRICSSGKGGVPVCICILGGGTQYVHIWGRKYRTFHWKEQPVQSILSWNSMPRIIVLYPFPRVGQMDINTVILTSASTGFIGGQCNLFLGKHDRPLSSLSDIFLPTHPTASPRIGWDHPSPEYWLPKVRQEIGSLLQQTSARACHLHLANSH